METILDRLDHWTRRWPDKCLFTFQDATGREKARYRYGEFSERTRSLAGWLRNGCGLEQGDRALLVYPPGLEMIVAFFACLRVGAIPAPVFAPPAGGAVEGFEKLGFVAADCRPRVALSTSDYMASMRGPLEASHGVWREWPADIDWRATDAAGFDAGPSAQRDSPHPTMFLQYTSGSTGEPKGVIVTHRNVLHNAHAVLDHCPIGVSWLPQYHDMGLIGHHLFVVAMGGTNHGFSPFDFLRRPALWLQTISRERATVTAGPNFAYQYCLRSDKVTDADLQGVDLSSLRMMLNAAEPVRAETYYRFRERFAPYGLPAAAHVAGFGLAENTVAVSLGGRQTLAVNKQQLQHRRLRIERFGRRNNNQVELVSCGRPLRGIDVRIVDPGTSSDVGNGRIGEIWVAGESRCAGYWGRNGESHATFTARLMGNERAGPYLRTGDLGFLYEGELFVCGRVKDLIIIRGVNYYPQDIEAIAESAVPQLADGAPGRVAAFAVDEAGEERLVLAVEVRDPATPPDTNAIVRAIRGRYFIEPQTILFVPPRAIGKTTSGKIARRQTCERWLRGELPILARYDAAEPETRETEGLRGILDRIRQLYDLNGREHRTVAEIGIDSLTMVDLVLEIQKHLQRRGAGNLVDSVDAGFLQEQTIGRLFALVDELEDRSLDELDIFKFKLRQLQELHAAADASRMRRDIAPELPAASVVQAWQPPANVLLTGATGFFGPFLLAELLDRTPAAVSTIVRAADAEHARQRVAAALRRAGLWNDRRDAQLHERLHTVAGDLAQPALGLAKRDWEELAERADAILHNGAAVNYVHSYEELRAQNVGGTLELLRLASERTAIPFHLVSSTFIYGWTVKPVLLEEDDNAAMQGLDFGYAQSKWAAEQLVFAAARNGLPVRIYRPSLISASTGGVGSRDDIAMRLLAFMIKQGLAVDARNQVSFLPADVAAEHIVAILRQLPTDDRVLHLTADDYYNFADVTRLITECYGYAFCYRSIPEFVAEMNRRCTPDDLLYPLRVFLTRSHRRIEAMRDKRYDNRNYRQARRQAGTVLREPPLRETVAHMVNFLLRERLIPQPTAGAVAGGHSFPHDRGVAPLMGSLAAQP
jgi:thioester reductase-like protein